MRNSFPKLFLLILTISSCSVSKNEKTNLATIEKLQMENERLKNSNEQNNAAATQEIYTFLTFQKENAEQAMNYYVALFDNSKIIEVKRWGKEGPGKEGTIMHATFSLNGKKFMCSDSPPIHDWDFTPAVSNFVEFKTESEIDLFFTKLSENGSAAMPLGNYGFSKKFGWVMDQFGISWQLNLN